MAKQLLGKEVTAALNERIKTDVEALKAKGVNPTLGIIRVGERPDDLSYERGATKRCETLGVEYKKYLLPAEVTQEELLKVIEEVNQDDNIHGVLMFRPLPKHIDQALVENALSAEKDVDCQTDASLTGVFTGKQIGFPPCTPQACMEILDHYGIDWQEGCCYRKKPGSGKTGSHDADQEECYRDCMPHPHEGYAKCNPRGGDPHCGSRPCRRGGCRVCVPGPDGY